MRPLLSALSAAATATVLGTSASILPSGARHLVMPSPDKNSPPAQLFGQQPSTDSQPVVPPKIKTLNPSSQNDRKPSSSRTSPRKDKYAPHPQTAISLSDTIAPHRSISSFSSFTRLNPSTASLLADLSAKITVLAPLNSAIDSLPRKPWESPSHETETYDGPDGQDRANRNLEKFVKAHLVSTAPWEEGDKVKTLAGREIWWEDRGDGARVVCPDGIEVEMVAGRVANGELWFVKGVLNYE